MGGLLDQRRRSETVVEVIQHQNDGKGVRQMYDWPRQTSRLFGRPAQAGASRTELSGHKILGVGTLRTDADSSHIISVVAVSVCTSIIQNLSASVRIFVMASIEPGKRHIGRQSRPS